MALGYTWAMPTPSSYPKINGKPCGSEWWKETVVDGHIPGTSYGDQFKKKIKPLITMQERREKVLQSGNDRKKQTNLKGMLYDRIENLRRKLPMGPQFGAERLTNGERDQIEWLLDRAEDAIATADDIWYKWLTRGMEYHSVHGERRGGWPLSEGDTMGAFSFYCRPEDAGRWIWENKYGGAPHSKTDIFCPSPIESFQRPRDRKSIASLFEEALAHLYCAEYGYWRIRLFKRAVAKYKKRKDSGIGGFAIEEPQSGAQPRFEGPSELRDNDLEDLDSCVYFGIDCRGDDEPEMCLSGVCPDEDELEDPPPFPGVDDSSLDPLGSSTGDVMPSTDEVNEAMDNIAFTVGAAAAGVAVLGAGLWYLGSRR